MLKFLAEKIQILHQIMFKFYEKKNLSGKFRLYLYIKEKIRLYKTVKSKFVKLLGGLKLME